MLRLKNLSNKFQKRLIRPLYGQTQAYPYAASLDASFRAADGTFVAPIVAGSANPARTAPAFLLKNGLVPGTVVVKSAAGEKVKVAVGNNALNGERVFGLLANFVGGDLDELGDENEVGVWRGVGGVFELLAPAFDPAIATAYSAVTNAGAPVPLYAGTDGRLTSTAPTIIGAIATDTATTTAVVVAYAIEAVGTSRIVIDLRV